MGDQDSLPPYREVLELTMDVTGIGTFHRVVYESPAPTPHWSKSMRSLLGYDPTKPADPEWFLERVDPRDRARMVAAIQRAEDPTADGLAEVEVRWRHPDGSSRWLFIRSITLHKQGTSSVSVGVVLDVTERRQAEQTNRRLSAILDATPDFVIIMSNEGRVEYLNRSAVAALGLHDLDPADQVVADFFEDGGAFLNGVGLPKAQHDGVWTGYLELRAAEPGANSRPVSVVLLAHRVGDEPAGRFSIVARDLSKERALEKRLLQSQKLESIGRLAGGVAHDFNNILSVVMCCAQLALDDIPQERAKARDELEEITRAATRAADLTRQLLAFGRQQLLQPRPVDVNAFLGETRPMYQRLVEEDITVKVVPAEEDLRVMVDPTQLQQVVLNLVINARDAMPQGGELLIESMSMLMEAGSATRRLELEPGDYVVLVVSDTGEGMDADTRRRIFEPFFTTKSTVGGSGLGLATVFGIVKQSGGAIDVYSEVGHGTTIKVFLPRTNAIPEDERPRQGITRMERHGVVLLAEDDEQVRQALVGILQRSGFDVLTAETPDAVLGLSRAYHGEIMLLLTDAVMPNMTGKQLAEAVCEGRPKLPVLYMSGYTENTIVHRGLVDPTINFIAKPITPGRLLQAVHAALSRSADG